MYFTSLSYLAFLPIVYVLCYFFKNTGRLSILLAASIYFYLSLQQLYLMFSLSLVGIATYSMGIALGHAASDKYKKRLLVIGVIINLLVLGMLRYFTEISTYMNSIFSLGLPVNRTLVTIGVSYFVFQAISYLADIYLELAVPERNFGYFFLYLCFFPKLLQGPIERANDLLPQLKQPYEFNYHNIRVGMLMFAWGLFKKVVVADRLALFVDTVYGDVHAYSGLSLIIATWLYALQIYFDFSGYTDMALGTARLFNIRLTQNFNSPYLATSISDFWRRWHISFSRWILDYIFKPLQMTWRNYGLLGTAVALLITFLLSGIWHGASWGFVVWGGLHGLYLACSVYYKSWQKKLHTALRIKKSIFLTGWQIAVTFNLVSFAWIFFRANTLADALYIVSHLCDGVAGVKNLLFHHGAAELWVLVLILSALALVRMCVVGQKEYFILEWPVWIRWPIYTMLLFATTILYVDNSRPFIYFQF